MAAVKGGDSGLHAGRAAADDGNALLLGGGGGEHLLGAGLAVADQRVDGAAEPMGIAVGVMAAHALDAGHHIVGMAVNGLVDHVRVGDELAADGEEIALAGGNGLFGGLKALQTAYGGDGLVDLAGLLESLGQPQVGVVAHMLTWVSPGHVLLGDHAAGGLDDVAVLLEDGGDADAFLHVDAAFGEFGGGHTHLKGHAALSGGAAGVEDLHQDRGSGSQWSRHIRRCGGWSAGSGTGPRGWSGQNGRAGSQSRTPAGCRTFRQWPAYSASISSTVISWVMGGDCIMRLPCRTAQRGAGAPGAGQKAHDLHASLCAVGMDAGGQQGQAILVVEGHRVPGAVLAVIHHVDGLGAARSRPPPHRSWHGSQDRSMASSLG